MLTSVILISHGQASTHMTPRSRQLSATVFMALHYINGLLLVSAYGSRNPWQASAIKERGGDLVEEDCAVGLEGLPLQAGAEDDQRRHRPVLVEAQVLCRSKQMLSLLLHIISNLIQRC
jgi:hypothetical protein